MSVNKKELDGTWADLEILIQTKNAPRDAIIDHRYRVIAKKDGTTAWLASFSDFYTIHNGMFWQVYQNGGDFVYRRMNNDGTWTDMGTLGTPVDYVAP